jgi:hypothetical protein
MLPPAARSRLAAGIAAMIALVAPGSRPAAAELLHDGGGWVMGVAEGDLAGVSPRLSRLAWWLDIQGRFYEDSGGYGQSLVRPAVGWAFAAKVVGHFGYAWVRTSGRSGRSIDEHRLWQQLLLKEFLSVPGLQSRTRLEQRLFENLDDASWRLRQFFKWTWPVPGIDRLALAGYEEVFFHLNDVDGGPQAGFDQNRAFVGPQWTFDDRGRIKAELGYLNQLIHRRRGRDVMEHLVSANLFLRF